MSEQLILQEASPQNELPKVFNDVILLSPGTWNGVEYTSGEIQKSFSNTDWSLAKNSFLYLDHQDTQNRGVETWAGFVRNVRVENGTLKGDLEVWHPMVAFYLSSAKAQFGVSATLRGFENTDMNLMQDFHYESFSIVSDPACKPAMINLNEAKEENSQLVVVTLGSLSTSGNLSVEDSETILAKVTGMEGERAKRGMSVAEFYAVPRDPPSASALPIFDEAHVRNAMARFNQTQMNPSERAHAKSKIIAAANKFGIKVSDEFKKLAYDMKNCSECGMPVSEDKMHEHMIGHNPVVNNSLLDKSMTELKGGRKEKEMTQELETSQVEAPKEELKNDESETKSTDSSEAKLSQDLSTLNSKLDKLISLLSQEKEAKLESDKNEMDMRIATVEKELKQMTEAPDRKTLSVGISLPDKRMGTSDSNEGMIRFLANLK